jgi:hypothetical protein
VRRAAAPKQHPYRSQCDLPPNPLPDQFDRVGSSRLRSLSRSNALT